MSRHQRKSNLIRLLPHVWNRHRRSFVLKLLDVDHLRNSLQRGLCQGGIDDSWITENTELKTKKKSAL